MNFSTRITFVICLFVFTNLTKSTSVPRNEDNSSENKKVNNTSFYVNETETSTNVNQTDSQRQRRLIPYSTFYIPQELQHGQRTSPYSQGSGYQQKGYRIQQKLRASPQQYAYVNNQNTPFSESNKLPGGFTPMTNTDQIAQQYILNKNPDFSVIYDKLALYKQLVQQQLAHPSIGYASVPQQQQKLIPIYKIRQPNYAPPIRTYQNNPSTGSLRYKTIITTPILSPTKTIVQSYTPQSIRDEMETVTAKYNSYESMTNPYQPPAPIKPSYPENVKYVSYQETPQKQQRNQVKYIYQPPIQVSEKPFDENIKYDYQEPIIVTQRPMKYSNYPETMTTKTILEQKPESMNYNYEPKTVFITPKPEITNNGYNQESVTQEPVTSKPVYIHTENSITEALKMLPQHNPLPQTFPPSLIDENATPSPVYIPRNSNTLGHLLKALQYSNALPPKFTTNNIGTSIKTLINILNALQAKSKDPAHIVIPGNIPPAIVPNEALGSTRLVDDIQEPIPEIPEQPQTIGGNPHPSHLHIDNNEGTTTQIFPMPTLDGGTPGKPGVDYPALSSIPHTSFDCKTQRYKGFFGDPETNCQVWHYCDLNGGQASFLCPNGTIFSQVALTCDWWYNVKCSTTPQLYVLNERLYKYILPFQPKFPEDFSGPLVDKYLIQKFEEQEAELQKTKKGKTKVTSTDSEENVSDNEELQHLNTNESEEIDRQDRRNDSNVDYVTSSKETKTVSNKEKS